MYFFRVGPISSNLTIKNATKNATPYLVGVDFYESLQVGCVVEKNSF